MQRRQTTQRLKILNYLQSVKTHPTAEMIYKEVVKEMPNLTLATVYRNLNLLAEEGSILKFEINNEFHFDADISKHQHCICKRCGKICDIFQKEISDYAMKKVKTKDFQLDGVMVFFNGTCKQCMEVR